MTSLSQLYYSPDTDNVVPIMALTDYITKDLVFYIVRETRPATRWYHRDVSRIFKGSGGRGARYNFHLCTAVYRVGEGEKTTFKFS